MYRGADRRGRLAGEMRWTVAALIALFGLAVIPAASVAAQPGQGGPLKVTVKPGSGSARTHFAISFKASITTGRTGHALYRITASDPGHAGCQSGVSAQVPPTVAGRTARVVLSPAQPRGWCAGTFRGRVWLVLSEPCQAGKACPAILPVPEMVGKFTFRVT